MADYFILSCQTLLSLSWHMCREIPAEGWRHVWKRCPLMILLWVMFVVLTALHLLGFFLDEIIFPEYRRLKVNKPVFIIGVPRSGTTFLHRVLAADPQFTSLSTWEVLFAPSVSERYLYRFLGGLLSPLGFVALALRRFLFRDMDKIHEIRLKEPEEDFLLLLWVGHCYLLAFLCPDIKAYWDLADFSRRVPEKRQRRVMSYYRACVQKHLLFHGSSLRFLSKNPSFTGMISSLQAAFADAALVACHRPPAQAVPSQLSALRPAMRLLGSGTLRPEVQSKVLDNLHVFYAAIREAAGAKLLSLPMKLIGENLQGTVYNLYRYFELEISELFAVRLKGLHERSCQYRSSHHYQVAEFGLSQEAIDNRYGDVWPLPDTLSPELS